MKAKILFFSLLAVPLLTGCASIIDGGPKAVMLNSEPEGAKVTISKPNGTEVLVTNTPAKVILARAGGYFKSADYRIVFEKPGYYPYETHLVSDLDPWYIGNFVFGGFIGELIIDPSTGDMFTFSSRELECNLISTGSPATTTTSESVKKTQGN